MPATATAPSPTPASVPCCPELAPCEVCDVLNFVYTLPFHPIVAAGDQRRIVPVDVILHFRLTRCSGPLALGDLLYTTTLLPGETVRLQSSDRHTRFSYDTETQLSYYNNTTSEESYYAAGMAAGMSNLSILGSSQASSSAHSSAVSGGGGLGIDLGFISIGGSAGGGSYDANSSSALATSLSQHASSLQQHMEVSTRAAASTSIGEVSSRTHTQTESEDQYEAASRSFSNANRCHAVTFLFYRINKCQTVSFELASIERRVNDPAAPSGATLAQATAPTGVAVRPSALLATAGTRLQVAQRANESVAVEQGDANAPALAGFAAGSAAFAATQLPIAVALRKAALAAVDQDLVAEGLVDKPGGSVSPKAQAALGWKREMGLPTPGVLVKGCLDECEVCEPELKQKIQLELTRMDLENQMLAKQIALLDKAQEYRCCPAESTETP
ncbi:MAG: hypothetical protein KGI51_09145 [Rhodospirillales bacterium]|nr:hypothetical protein [Rhodospirillales bacterium]